MIKELLFFLYALLAGGFFRIVYFLMRLMQRKTKVLALTVITDCLFGLVFIAPLLVAAFFYNDGLIPFYCFAAEALGFCIVKLLRL